ncbi:MAG: adenine phosphoribosyltransferase, partial [Shewanella sp.]
MAMNTETLSLIKQSIKTIPNYPKEGILFRDVTSLLEDAKAYRATIDLLVE